MKKLLVFAVIGILMMAGSAFGDALNIRPASGVTPPELATLQSFFDGTLTPLQTTNLGINAYTDQSPLAIFTPSGGTFLDDIATLMFYEGAAYAGTNSFGIYSASDPTKMLTVFAGPVSAPATALVSWLGNDVWLGGISGPPTIADFGTDFGYFLTSVQGELTYTFYSEDDKNPGGLAQMLIYNDKEFGNEWYIGVEDLCRVVSSDEDFEDMIIRASEVQGGKVPEPISLILLGSGLAGAGLVRRFRKK